VEGSVKERLTGALIFVAAFIVIVSEMFSGPGHESASIEPPAETAAHAGQPLRTYSMTLDESGEARVAAPGSLVPESTFPDSTAMEQPAAQAKVPESQVVQAPAVTPPAAVSPAAQSVPAAIAEAKPPAASSGASRSDGDNKLWLQVGLFGVRDNAERLEKKLRAAGFAVAMDKQLVRGKDMFRLRAGPVRDRTEALALQARLKAAGQDSNLPPP
jgi:cell division septation protein DedD